MHKISLKNFKKIRDYSDFRRTVLIFDALNSRIRQSIITFFNRANFTMGGTQKSVKVQRRLSLNDVSRNFKISITTTKNHLTILERVKVIKLSGKFYYLNHERYEEIKEISKYLAL